MHTSLHMRDWEEMAKVDPLWAILSDPAKRFRNWDLDEFLRTGQEEVRNLMASVRQVGPACASRLRHRFWLWRWTIDAYLAQPLS